MPSRWASGPSHFLFLYFGLVPNYIVYCNAGRQPPKCIYLSFHNGYKQLKARDCHIYPISLLAQLPNEDQRHNKESILQARSRQRKSNTSGVLVSRLPRIQTPMSPALMAVSMLLWKNWKATTCPETSVTYCYHLDLSRQSLPTPSTGIQRNPNNTETRSSQEPLGTLPGASRWAPSSLSPSFYTHSNSHAQSDPFTPSRKLTSHLTSDDKQNHPERQDFLPDAILASRPQLKSPPLFLPFPM